MMKQLLLVGSLALICGCTTPIPLASPEQENAAKQFKAKDGFANLYVVQNGGYGSNVIRAQVIVDGLTQGTLIENTYHLLSVRPGPHSVFAVTGENEDTLIVDTVAGRNYFVAATASAGWKFIRVKLSMLEEEDGKKHVLEGRRAQGIPQGILVK